MRILVLFFMLSVLPCAARAGMAEAKDLAKSMNCAIKTIAVIGKIAGEHSATLYKIECDMPASSSVEDKKANGTLWIKCDVALCALQKKGE